MHRLLALLTTITLLLAAPSSLLASGITAKDSRLQFDLEAERPKGIKDIAALEAATASGPGVFLQRDPSGFEDSVNLYAFAKNDPVNGRDPTGKIFIGLTPRLREVIDHLRQNPEIGSQIAELDERRDVEVDLREVPEDDPDIISNGGGRSIPLDNRVDRFLSSFKRVVQRFDVKYNHEVTRWRLLEEFGLEPTSLEAGIAHELGHTYYEYIAFRDGKRSRPQDSDDKAVKFENAVRRVERTAPRPSHAPKRWTYP